MATVERIFGRIPKGTARMSLLAQWLIWWLPWKQGEFILISTHFRGDTALQFGAFVPQSDSQHNTLIAIQHSFFLFLILGIFITWCIKRKEPPHHNRFTALFPGPPRWAGARRELLDFTVQGKINRGRHTDHLAERHSIRTNQYSPTAAIPKI